MSQNLSVLIVDDDLAYRKLLAKIIGDLDGVHLLPSAASGHIALARLRNHEVDLVLLDMHMPEMDGLETLRRIRETHPDIGVIIISGEYASDTDEVMQALELGALEFLTKAPDPDDNGRTMLPLRTHLRTLFRQFQGKRDLQRARRISSDTGRFLLTNRTESAEPNRVSPGPATPRTKNTAARRSGGRAHSGHPGRIDLVVIGASTGGPNALSEVIPRLPHDLRTPVLIVQHMPASLTASLAQSLDAKSPLDVHEAVDGEPLISGTVFLAPGGRHLTVVPRRSRTGSPPGLYIRLDDGPPENSVRPSADVLFRSVAASFAGRTLAVVMTGMGSDGMKGVLALKERGCYCITQTRETCVVYGMPRAVDEATLSDERVDLHAIAQRIVGLAGTSGRGRVP